MANYHMAAPCHFGLESVLSGELKALGASDVKAEDGKVHFTGDEHILVRANLCLRTAERVLIELASFTATSFEELFQGVSKIPLEDFVGSKDAFPVKGWSLKASWLPSRTVRKSSKRLRWSGSKRSTMWNGFLKPARCISCNSPS